MFDKNIKFDESCLFTEEEKADLMHAMEEYDAARPTVQWGKYEIFADPTTIIAFNHSFSYYDELEALKDDLLRRFPQTNDIGVAAYLSQGYSEEEFRQDTEDPLFQEYLSGVVDMAMDDRLLELCKERDREDGEVR